MGRISKAAITFAIVGVLAASTVRDRGLFVMGFFVFFFGGIAAALVLLSTGRWTEAEQEIADIQNPDPFIDDAGVHHTTPVASSILRTARQQARFGERI